MKLISFLFLVSILLFLLLVPTQHAQTIIQGSSSSYSSVTTEIEGLGNVTTHIESTVNGQTKTLDSNQPGVHTLYNSSANNQITGTPTLTPTDTPSPTPTLSPKEILKKHFVFQPITQLQQLFHSALRKILSFFHL